jgi:hypothetical protein
MNDTRQPDGDPRADSVLDAPISAYDEMRHRCPVEIGGHFHVV